MASTLDDSQDPNSTQNQQNKLQTISTGAGSSGSAGASTAPSSGTAASTGTAGGVPGNANTPVSPTSQQLQGSGNFTNIQKYLSANQNAGNNIANQVNSNLSSGINTDLSNANNYSSQLNSDLTQANQTAQTGSNYYNQLQGIATDITNNTLTGAQVSQPDMTTFQNWLNNTGNTSSLANAINNFATGNGQSLANYQSFLSGQAYNPNALTNAQQNYQTNAQAASTAAQQDLQNLSTGNGQLNVLQNLYGGNVNPNYTEGMANLDQAFLGSGNNLNNVASNLNNLNNNAQQQLAQAQQASGSVANMNQEQSQLQNELSTQSQGNQQAYLNMLNSYINPLNQQNAVNYGNLVNALNSYVPAAGGQTTAARTTNNLGGLDAQQIAQLGINPNEQVFNVLNAAQNGNNPNALLSQYVTQNTPIGQNQYNNIATNQDLTNYNNLLQMLSPTQQTAISNAVNAGGSGLTAANNTGIGGWTAVQGTNGQTALQNALQNAQSNFNTSLANENPSATAWNQNLSGNGTNLLNNGLSAIQNQLGVSQFSPTNNNSGTTTSNPANIGGNSNSGNQAFLGENGNIFSNADNNIIGNFQNFLNQQNYGPTIGGVATQDAFDQQMAAINNSKLPTLIRGKPNPAYNDTNTNDILGNGGVAS